MADKPSPSSADQQLKGVLLKKTSFWIAAIDDGSILRLLNDSLSVRILRNDLCGIKHLFERWPA